MTKSVESSRTLGRLSSRFQQEGPISRLFAIEKTSSSRGQTDPALDYHKILSVRAHERYPPARSILSFYWRALLSFSGVGRAAFLGCPAT